jgi:hypothetical protein
VKPEARVMFRYGDCESGFGGDVIVDLPVR